jgi:hypothetical protein
VSWLDTLWHVWLLYYYVAHAMRENILQVRVRVRV